MFGAKQNIVISCTLYVPATSSSCLVFVKLVEKMYINKNNVIADIIQDACDIVTYMILLFIDRLIIDNIHKIKITA